MLRRIISKSEYEALPDEVQKLYGASKGKFVLDVEADPQVDTLTRELNEARTSLAAKENFVDPKSIPSADDILRDLNAEKEGRASDVQRYQSLIAKALIEEKASAIASKISTAPAVMKRFVSDSLVVDFTADSPVVRVKGEDGTPSDTSFDDLEKKLVANPDFSSIIVGTKATGGATQTKPDYKPSGGGTKADLDLVKADPASLVEYLNSKKPN